MEVKDIVFYNHYGNGDIFESREFVKWWMRIVKCNSYSYAHGKNYRILLDMPELHQIEVTDIMDMRKPFVVDGNTLYINTWIGRDGRYVLPGIGCVVEKIFEMHSDMAALVGIPRLDGSPYDYIPKIDFTYYETDKIDYFVENNGEFVYISNGNVQSNQAMNFDFSPVINRLCDKYKDILFVVTDSVSDSRDNLVYTRDITRVDGCDLNEIAYLSMFTKLMIGRNSGPHVFTQHHDNWQRSSKTSLNFTYTQGASHFIFSGHLPMKKVWSPCVHEDDVFNVIDKEMERIYE